MLDSAKARAIWAFCGLIFGNFIRRGIYTRLAGFDAPFQIFPYYSRPLPPSFPRKRESRGGSGMRREGREETRGARARLVGIRVLMARRPPSFPRKRDAARKSQGREETRRARASRQNQGSHSAASPRHSRESENPEGGGMRREGAKKRGGRGRLVRIRIYGIIGFSGFYRRVFDWRALIRIHLGGIGGYGGKRKLGETKSCKSRQSCKS